jgi:microcystin-dependent protein
MDDQFLGEIQMFAGNFPPKDWVFCHGQTLSVQKYTSLFGIIGYTYGGQGDMFMLPDLRGRVPIHVDTDKGITLGTKGGTETSFLTADQLPEHTHRIGSISAIKCTNRDGDTNNPSDSFPAKNVDLSYRYGTPAEDRFFASDAFVAKVVHKGGQPINNMMPYLGISYIIALTGTYPY